MKMKFPTGNQVVLSQNEQWRIVRYRLAVVFGQLPSAIDTMPFKDVADALEIARFDELAEREQARQSAQVMSHRGRGSRGRRR